MLLISGVVNFVFVLPPGIPSHATVALVVGRLDKSRDDELKIGVLNGLLVSIY